VGAKILGILASSSDGWTLTLPGKSHQAPFPDFDVICVGARTVSWPLVYSRIMLSTDHHLENAVRGRTNAAICIFCLRLCDDILLGCEALACLNRWPRTSHHAMASYLLQMGGALGNAC
jgi:hypothetical protein